MSVIEEYWNDCLLYFIGYKVAVKQNVELIEKEYHHLFVLPPGLKKEEITQILKTRIFGLTKVLYIDEFEDGLSLK